MKIRSNRRRGSVLPIFAVCLSTLVGMIALGVDLGVLAIANTQAQAAADIGALGGARMLNGLNANNKPDNRRVVRLDGDHEQLDPGHADHREQPETVTVQNGIYSYSTSAKAFAVDMSGNNPSGYPWTAMQISVSATQPTYFAQIFGLGPFNIGATAIAVHRPRDIALTLDFSTSMQYSSNTNVRGSPNSNSPTTGSMNGDTLYPQFGPWAIYPSSSGANPMMATSGYADRGGEAHATSNLTTSTSSGPPLVNDFLYDTSGSANGTGPSRTLSSAQRRLRGLQQLQGHLHHQPLSLHRHAGAR